MPTGYRVVTKGRLLGFDGTSSPQVDVVVLRPGYPPGLLGKKHYLAGGVAAAFECKLTLTSKHVADAIDRSAKIRRLLRPRYGTPYAELTSPIITGLLAHAHNWTAPGSHPRVAIERAIAAADKKHVNHPREMLDLICIANLGGWASGRVAKGIAPAQATDAQGRKAVTTIGSHITRTSYNAMFASSGQPHSPLSMFLTRLIKKLSYEDACLRPIARDFGHIGFPGQGITNTGALVRDWPDEVLSKHVHRKMQVELGPAALEPDEERRWSPWSGLYW